MTTFVGRFFGEGFDFISPAILPDGTVKSDFRLSDHIAGKMTVVFFYTMDFSSVCTTELIALANRARKFADRGIEVVVVSADSHLSHQQWRSKSYKGGGIGNFPFPIVSDVTRNIAKAYEVLVNDSLVLRGTFILDKEGYFRHSSVYDLPMGRNIDEIIRIIDGLQAYQQTGMLCPAGWQPGDETLKSDPDFMTDYLVAHAAGL
ncbi:MAG TPA: peroxiredoxin [Alphaproteobacteria bacterium]